MPRRAPGPATRRKQTFQLRQLEKLKLQKITITTVILHIQNTMNRTPDLRSVREKVKPQKRYEHHRLQAIVPLTTRKLIRQAASRVIRHPLEKISLVQKLDFNMKNTSVLGTRQYVQKGRTPLIPPRVVPAIQILHIHNTALGTQHVVQETYQVLLVLLRRKQILEQHIIQWVCPAHLRLKLIFRQQKPFRLFDLLRPLLRSIIGHRRYSRPSSRRSRLLLRPSRRSARRSFPSAIRRATCSNPVPP